MPARTDPSVQAFQHNARELDAGSTSVQTVAAAGATQDDAAAISDAAEYVVVTVTASTQGVRLPSAANARQKTVMAQSDIGCNVYPAEGETIYGAAQDAALALALNKSAVFVPVSATVWRVVLGA